MATENLQITDITASQNSKEVTANAAHNALDNAINKYVTKAISGDTAFSTAETRGYGVIILTGTPGAPFTVNMPDTNKRVLAVVNLADDTGTIRNSAGSTGSVDTIAIASGDVVTFLYTGTDFYSLTATPVLTFLGLTDTPSSYSGQGGKAVAVNAGETGTEFVDFPASAATGSTNLSNTFRGALVYNSVSQTGLAASTDNLLTFDSEVYDTDSIHDTGVNPGRLTVPTGVTKIRLKGQVFLTGASNNPDAYFYKNGAAATPIREISRNASGANIVHSAVLEVTAGDYFEFREFHNTGTGATTAGLTWFSMEVVETVDSVNLQSVVVATRPKHKGAKIGFTTPPTAVNATSGYLVAWDNEIFDTDSIADLGTNATRLTVPAGVNKIRLNCQVTFTNFATNEVALLEIWKNGSSFTPHVFIRRQIGFATINFQAETGVIEVAEGDYFEVRVDTTADTSIDFNSDSWFEMEVAEETGSTTVPTGYIAVQPSHRGALLQASGTQSFTTAVEATFAAWDSAAYNTPFDPDDGGGTQRFWLGVSQTFVDANVTVAADTIAVTGHGFTTGEGPLYLTTTGTLPGGLATATKYWVIAVDANTIQLATSRANALAGSQVTITSAAGGGTHTLETAPYLVVPAGITKIRVHAQPRWATGGTGVHNSNIYKNGSTAYAGRPGQLYDNSGSNTTFLPTGVPVLEVSEGDVFKLNMIQSSGGSLNAGGDVNHVFSIEVVEVTKALTYPGVTVERPVIGCRINRGTSTQSATNNTDTPIAWTAEEYDTGYRGTPFHDNSTNNTRITIPAGVTKARFTGQLNWAFNVTGLRRLAVWKDGAAMTPENLNDVQPVQQTSTVTTQMVDTGVIDVVAGEYYELVGLQSSGGALNANSGGNGRSWFAMEVVETEEAAYPPEPLDIYLNAAAWDTAAFPTSVEVWSKVMIRRVSLFDELAGSQGYAAAGPNGGAVAIDVQVDGVSIGTITFADSTGAAQTATFTTSGGSQENIDAGSVLSLVGPANWQAMDKIAISLWGFRT